MLCLTPDFDHYIKLLLSDLSFPAKMADYIQKLSHKRQLRLPVIPNVNPLTLNIDSVLLQALLTDIPLLQKLKNTTFASLS